MHHPKTTLIALALATLGGVGGLRANVPADLCPFAAPRAAPVAAPSEVNLRLAGVVSPASASGKQIFAFHDPVKRQSFLVELNQGTGDILIKDYDEARGVVRIQYDGRIVELQMPVSQVSAPASTPSHPRVVPSPVPPVGPGANPAASATHLNDLARQLKEARDRRLKESQR